MIMMTIMIAYWILDHMDMDMDMDIDIDIYIYIYIYIQCRPSFCSIQFNFVRTCAMPYCCYSLFLHVMSHDVI